MKKWFLGALMAVVAASFGAMAYAATNGEGSVGGRPANPDPDNPRTNSIFIYNLKAGQVRDDQIYLSNSGSTDVTVRLTAVDGALSNTGAMTCKQEAESKEGVARWIELSTKEVTVPASGNALVDFRLTVPNKVDVGEHNGCIAIQKKDSAGEKTGSIVLYMRSAVRVAVVVPGDIHREVSIDRFETISSFDGPKITFALKNNGNVSADTDTRLSVYDLFGNKVHGHDIGQMQVASEADFLVENYEVPYKPLFGGWYKMKLGIEYDKRAGKFGTTDKNQLTSVEGNEVIVFIWPSLIVLLVAGMLLIAGVLFLIWRYGQSKTVTKSAKSSLKKSSGQVMWGPYEVRSGDTLTALARKHGVTVEKLSALNKLSSSSKLEPGQRIYVPRKK